MLCLHQLWFVLSADIGHDNYDDNDDNDNDDNNDDGHDNDKAVFVIFLTFAFVLSYRFQSENMMKLFRPINWFLLQNCYRVDELLITDLPTDQDQMVI